MKIGKKGLGKVSKPETNQFKKTILVLLIVVMTAGLIAWVYSIGQKIEDTITVVMLNQNIYKNQLITESMLKPYDMLRAEFEKYALVDNGGKVQRKIVLWEERNKIINTFAAYPLHQDTYAEYRFFIKSRVDNSDNVLYSFPGKEIVPLEISSNELQAFKTFLQPGDRLNVDAIFSERQNIVEEDGFGNKVKSQVEVFKTEPVFRDIMIADLLNQQGESILDLYAYYNSLGVYEQAKLDSSQSFKDRTEPRTLLVALTPEEKDRYYYYLSKSNVEFRVSMPQRIE